MARYAIIQSNMVTNVCEWDGVTTFTPGNGASVTLLSSLPIGVGVGWTLSGSTWSAPATAPQTTGLTFQQFVSLFTVAEFNSIIGASITNPAIMIGFMKLVSYSGNINLNMPLVTTSLAGLVSLGLITSGRQTAILAGIIMNQNA